MLPTHLISFQTPNVFTAICILRLETDLQPLLRTETCRFVQSRVGKQNASGRKELVRNIRFWVAADPNRPSAVIRPSTTSTTSTTGVYGSSSRPTRLPTVSIIGLCRHSRTRPSRSAIPRLPADQPILATELVTLHPVLRLSSGDPERDLHDQCHRVGEHEFAENDQEPLLVSQRRGTIKTLLSCPTKHQSEMDDAN